MKFLSAAHSASLAPKQSIISLLRSNLAGMEPARSHKIVHASDVTKDDFCARRVALLDVTGKRLPDQYIPAALRATFYHGAVISDLVREEWLGDAAIGHWHCMRCGTTKTFSPKPHAIGCTDDKKHMWRYQEVNFVSKSTGIDGSIDVLVKLGGQKLFVTEVKIMAPDAFADLEAPLAEHRIRTNLYLFLVKDSLSPFRHQVNHDEGRVLYVSRGHGKKHPEFKEVLPWKEFLVYRNDSDIQSCLAAGKAALTFKKDGTLPKGVCQTAASPLAKSCCIAAECFSGKWPAGLKVEVDG